MVIFVFVCRLFSNKYDINVKSKNDISDRLEDNIGISSQGFVELYVWGAADAIVFQVCALSSRRTLDNGLSAWNFSNWT